MASARQQPSQKLPPRAAPTEAEAGFQQEASLRYKDYKPIPELATIRFDYDQAALREEARAALRDNSAWLKGNHGVEVQIQGHCDDRGTTEYNLSLGQRRAQAVRDYYKMLGVSFKRISTISYGEEMPACTEATEPCWQINRRAETLIRRE